MCEEIIFKLEQQLRTVTEQLSIAMEALIFLKVNGIGIKCGDIVGCTTEKCNSGKCKHQKFEHCSFEKWLDFTLAKIEEVGK